MKTIEIKSAWQGNSDCNACSVRSSALFAELNEEDFSKIHSPIDDLRYEANTGIYTQGDSAEHLFTLREGYIKLLHINSDAPLFKREDMGLMMDVKFETISRALASMAEQGLISNISRLSIQIPSMKNLESFSQAGP